MSKIIFLNGCGSAGKTSIAKQIQYLSNELWLHFGVDSFIDMLPADKTDNYFKFIKNSDSVRVESGPLSAQIFGLMPHFAQLLAGADNNLIIDEVLLDDQTLESYAKYLSKHQVYYIGMHCDIAILREREIARGDRCVGLANDQITRVHKGKRSSYDFEVDTSHNSPEAIAQQILQFVDRNPAPTAFRSLIT